MCYPSPFSVPKECLLLWREQRAQGQGGMYRGVTEHTHTRSYSHQNNQQRSQQPVRAAFLSEDRISHDALCPETGR